MARLMWVLPALGKARLTRISGGVVVHSNGGMVDHDCGGMVDHGCGRAGATWKRLSDPNPLLTSYLLLLHCT